MGQYALALYDGARAYYPVSLPNPSACLPSHIEMQIQRVIIGPGDEAIRLHVLERMGILRWLMADTEFQAYFR